MSNSRYEYSELTKFYTDKYENDLSLDYWNLFKKYNLSESFWHTETKENYLEEISETLTVADFFKNGSSNLWFAMFLNIAPNFFVLTDKFLNYNSEYIKKSNQCYDFDLCEFYEDYKEKARELLDSEIYTNCIDSHNQIFYIFENSLEDLTKGFLLKIGKALNKENKTRFLELVKDFCLIADK
jgi:hypothetical protein